MRGGGGQTTVPRPRLDLAHELDLASDPPHPRRLHPGVEVKLCHQDRAVSQAGGDGLSNRNKKLHVPEQSVLMFSLLRLSQHGGGGACDQDI